MIFDALRVKIRDEGVVILFQVTEDIKRTISYLPCLEIQFTKMEYR